MEAPANQGWQRSTPRSWRALCLSGFATREAEPAAEAPVRQGTGSGRATVAGSPCDTEEQQMKNRGKARFAIKSWDEKPFGEGDDLPKLTRAVVAKTFTGDIAGEGHVEYLMMYRADGSASFVGLERIVGRIGEKAGSFVLQRIGTFENGQAKESYSVVPGSGTGELVGLKGEGTSSVGHGMEHPFELSYEFGE